MDNSFFKYLQILEILAFFSGFPLIYLLVSFISDRSGKKNGIGNRLYALLPFVYAVIGILFVGLQLKKLYPDFSSSHISAEIQNSFLAIWGVSTLLFFIPVLNKKPVFSLLHSLVFLFVIVYKFYIQLSTSTPDNDVLKNYIRVYTDSIILGAVVLGVLIISYYSVKFFRQKIS